MVSVLCKCFRLAEVASVAAAITKMQHRDWVKSFLVQAEGKVDVQGQDLKSNLPNSLDT